MISSEHDLEIDSEKEFQEYLVDGMKNADWGVDREVSPNGSQDRVDIIASKEGMATVGIETKYVTNSGPRETGKALTQIISQYAGERYDDMSVDVWGTALYGDGFFTTDFSDFSSHSEEYQFACRRINNQLGVGYVVNHRGLVIMDFGISVPELRVPLFSTDGGRIDDDYVQCDIQRIQQKVSEQLPV
jgi:hypothetical protein